METVSLLVDTQGTGTLLDEQLEVMARDAFPPMPQGIIETLELRRRIYAPSATT